MEAPNKIYICPSDLAGIDYEDEWLEYPFGDSIEYIRTDVFIKKVCEFIRINAEKHVYFDEGNSEWYDSEEFVEDFKNYMKGK